MTLYHPVTDHHEEAVSPLHCQLLAARPLLLVSRLGLLHDLRQGGREAELQSHRAARCHCVTAHPE